jgi:hypothetical protein
MIDDRLQAGQDLAVVSEPGGAAVDGDRPVIHRVVARRAPEHQPVEQRRGDADRAVGAGVAEQARHRRPV